MQFEDVTPIMIHGEARVIHEGKLILVVGSEDGTPVSRAPDIALVLLDQNKNPVTMGSVVSSVTSVRRDRSARHLFDRVEGDRWYGSVFEVSTLLMPLSTTAISVVADGIDAVAGRLSLTVEDGMSRSHLFPMKITSGQKTAVIASLYRHGEDWKLRAYGHGYAASREVLSQQLGIEGAWPRAYRPSADRFTQSRSRSTPPASPATSRPSVPPIPLGGTRQPPHARENQSRTPPPIDLARLSAIEKDTAAVSTLLSDIFSDVKESQPIPLKRPSGLNGLDEAHAAVLAELMAKGQMEASDFSALARRHGLMPSGAVETINEWAFDHVGDIVVSETSSGCSFVAEYKTAIEELSLAA
jgi:stress response protein SCP2